MRLVVALVLVAVAAADKSDVNQLALEVDALQTLAQLDLNDDQLKELAKLTPSAAKSGNRKPAKASAKYVAGLKQLRDALVEGDADTIDEQNEKLDKLREAEKPQIDDKVEVTDTAKKRTAAVLKILTARQAAGYLGNFGEELPDPVELIKTTVEVGQKLTGKQWETVRDRAAAEIGWVVAGFDDEKVRKVHDQALALLNKLHGKKLEDDTAEKEARALFADVSATDMLRHILEHDLAELLSNPQLSAAIEAHLKK